MKTQGASRNPGAQQVTSKGTQPKNPAKVGSGRAATSTAEVLGFPNSGKHNFKTAVTAQQVPASGHARGVTADYAGDGKSYGVGGNKTLRDPSKSSPFFSKNNKAR